MNIDEKIEVITDSITKDTESSDALRYSQAALNLAHVKQVMQQATDTKSGSEARKLAPDSD